MQPAISLQFEFGLVTAGASTLTFVEEFFHMKPTRDELMTVGELRRQLEKLPDDASIFFGCESLRFYRIKGRGENYYQIEFDQSVYDDDDGRVFVTNLEDSGEQPQ